MARALYNPTKEDSRFFFNYQRPMQEFVVPAGKKVIFDAPVIDFYIKNVNGPLQVVEAVVSQEETEVDKPDPLVISDDEGIKISPQDVPALKWRELRRIAKNYGVNVKVGLSRAEIEQALIEKLSA